MHVISGSHQTTSGAGYDQQLQIFVASSLKMDARNSVAFKAATDIYIYIVLRSPAHMASYFHEWKIVSGQIFCDRLFEVFHRWSLLEVWPDKVQKTPALQESCFNPQVFTLHQCCEGGLQVAKLDAGLTDPGHVVQVANPKNCPVPTLQA